MQKRHFTTAGGSAMPSPSENEKNVRDYNLAKDRKMRFWFWMISIAGLAALLVVHELTVTR